MSTIKTILLACIIICCGTVKAQSNHNLEGQWTVDVNRSLKDISGREKLKYDSMPERAKQNMKRAFEGRTFQFGAGNSVLINFSIKDSQRSIEGQWAYQSGDNTLTITTNGTSKQYEVAWETDDRVRLIYKDVSSGGMLKGLYLTRIN